MKLFYTPGACSISPHVTLRELGVPFELQLVDLRAKKLGEGGGDYLAVNPKGYVPAIQLENGELLTEGAVLVQHLADQHPEKKLIPPVGTMERYRLQERMHFIATELHKGMSPLYNPKASDEFKASLIERLEQRLGVFAKLVEGKQFIMGDAFTVADPYAFYVLRAWQKSVKRDLTKWPALEAYYKRLSERPTVRAALEVEGLTP